MKKVTLAITSLICLTLNARAEDVVPKDKSQYSLFNPTPAALMRQWYTDHAGTSPYTIDAGHFAADVSVEYSYGHQVFWNVDVTDQGWNYGTTVLKAGLLNNLDVAVAIQPYATETTTAKVGGVTFFRQTISGFADTTASLKLNVWGNDGGATALAVGGSVTFPTANGLPSGHQVYGGPVLNFSAQLPWAFELRIVSDVILSEDYLRRRQATFGNLISLGHTIIGNLRGYCSFVTHVSTVSNSDWSGTLRAGVDYRLANNLELFVGSDFPVNASGDFYAPFIGAAARF